MYKKCLSTGHGLGQSRVTLTCWPWPYPRYPRTTRNKVRENERKGNTTNQNHKKNIAKMSKTHNSDKRNGATILFSPPNPQKFK
eukprot:5748313-Amphidinium_carterae.1